MDAHAQVVHRLGAIFIRVDLLVYYISENECNKLYYTRAAVQWCGVAMLRWVATPAYSLPVK